MEKGTAASRARPPARRPARTWQWVVDTGRPYLAANTTTRAVLSSMQKPREGVMTARRTPMARMML